MLTDSPGPTTRDGPSCMISLFPSTFNTVAFSVPSEKYALTGVSTLIPGDPRSLCAFGLSQGFNGEGAGACASLGASLERNPSDTVTLGFLGIALTYSRLDPARAVLLHQRAIRLSQRSPHEASNIAALGLAYLAAGRPGDAVASAEHATQLAPDSLDCAVLRAIVLVATDAGPESLRALAHVRKLRPDLSHEALSRFMTSIAGPLLESFAPSLARGGWRT